METEDKKYEFMLDMPHPISENHPRLSVLEYVGLLQLSGDPFCETDWEEDQSLLGLRMADGIPEEFEINKIIEE